MTTAKVWDGAGWVTVAGGISQAAFDAQNARITALEAKPSYPLDVQQICGYTSAYRTDFAGTVTWHVLERGAATGTDFLRLQITPSVDCWWDTIHQNGLVRKQDAAYHYVYCGMRLTPADADGQTQAVATSTQHSTVDNVMHVTVPFIWKLSAGIAYTLDAIMGAGSGGTWTYYKDARINLKGIAWAR